MQKAIQIVCSSRNFSFQHLLFGCPRTAATGVPPPRRPRPLRPTHHSSESGVTFLQLPVSCLFCFTDRVQHLLWLCSFAGQAGSERTPLRDGAAPGGDSSPGTGTLPGKSGQDENQESICPFSSQVLGCKMRAYFPAPTFRGMHFAFAQTLGTV